MWLFREAIYACGHSRVWLTEPCCDYVPGLGKGCQRLGLKERLESGEAVEKTETFPRDPCLNCLRRAGCCFFPSWQTAEDFLLGMSPGNRQAWELILRPYLRDPLASVGPAVKPTSDLSLDELEAQVSGVASCRAERDSNGVVVFSGLQIDRPGLNMRPGVTVAQPPGASHSNWDVAKLPLPEIGTFWHD